MTSNQDCSNIIVIVIALDSLYWDFDTATTSLLETSNKTIDKIQSILQSKEAKILASKSLRIAMI